MDFKPIDISMKQMVEHYTAKWKLECSEYTFSNLLMWGCGGNIMLAEDEQVLYILLHWGNERFMFAPLTVEPESEYYQTALDKAAEYMRSNCIPPVFKGISGPIRAAFERCTGYELIDDRNNSDYVYTMESLRDLAGKSCTPSATIYTSSWRSTANGTNTLK